MLVTAHNFIVLNLNTLSNILPFQIKPKVAPF